MRGGPLVGGAFYFRQCYFSEAMGLRERAFQGSRHSDASNRNITTAQATQRADLPADGCRDRNAKHYVRRAVRIQLGRNYLLVQTRPSGSLNGSLF